MRLFIVLAKLHFLAIQFHFSFLFLICLDSRLKSTKDYWPGWKNTDYLSPVKPTCVSITFCQEFISFVRSPEGGKPEGVCGEKPGQLGCTASRACQSYSKVQIRAAFIAVDVWLAQAVLWRNLRLKNRNQEQQAGVWWAGLFVSLQPDMRELMTAKLPTICSESKVAPPSLLSPGLSHHHFSPGYWNHLWISLLTAALVLCSQQPVWAF